MKKELTLLWNSKNKLRDIYSYYIGNYRYKIYYSKNKLIQFLMRKFIREQIDFRINNMNEECFNKGECIMCGCQTTALQMANKSCDKPCYPKMMNKKQWEKFKRLKVHVEDDKVWLQDRNNKLILLSDIYSK